MNSILDFFGLSEGDYHPSGPRFDNALVVDGDEEAVRNQHMELARQCYRDGRIPLDVCHRMELEAYAPDSFSRFLRNTAYDMGIGREMDEHYSAILERTRYMVEFGNELQHVEDAQQLQPLFPSETPAIPLLRLGDRVPFAIEDSARVFLGWNFQTQVFEGWEQQSVTLVDIKTTYGTFFGVENDIRHVRAFLTTLEMSISNNGNLSDAALQAFEAKNGISFGNAVAHFLNRHSSRTVSYLCQASSSCNNYNPLTGIYLYETYGDEHHSAWAIFRRAVARGMTLKPEIFSTASPEAKSIFHMPYFLLDILSLTLAECSIGLAELIWSKQYRRNQKRRTKLNKKLARFGNWEERIKHAYDSRWGQLALSVLFKVGTFVFLTGVTAFLSSSPSIPTGNAIQPIPDLHDMTFVDLVSGAYSVVLNVPSLIKSFVFGASFQLGQFTAAILFGIPLYAVLGLAPSLTPLLSMSIMPASVLFATIYIRSTSMAAGHIMLGSTKNFFKYLVGSRDPHDHILNIPSNRWLWRLLGRTLISSMFDFLFMAITSEVLKDVIMFTNTGVTATFGIGTWGGGWMIFFLLLVAKTIMRIIESLVATYFFKTKDKLAEEDLKYLITEKKNDRLALLDRIMQQTGNEIDMVLVSEDSHLDRVVVECTLKTRDLMACSQIRMRLEEMLSPDKLQDTKNAQQVVAILYEITQIHFKFDAYKDDDGIKWSFTALRPISKTDPGAISGSSLGKRMLAIEPPSLEK